MASTHAFSEKVALVTEGTTPVGRAVAMQLALCGAYVVVSHPADDPDLSAVEEMKSLGTLAAGAPYSAAGLTGAKEITSCIEGLYGRLDLLVNCSPVSRRVEFSATGESDFRRVVENLLESAFFNTKESVRLMAERPKPRIVNVFSAADGAGSVADVGFRAINAALAEFTLALANELPVHFQVNGVRVSETGKTQATATDLDPALFRQKAGVDADDVARAVLFLLSSEAGGLRGQILDIVQ